MTGISSKAVLGMMNPHQNKNCLVYRSCNGYLIGNGDQKKGGRSVDDEEVITMKVNTIDWHIRWSVEL